MKTLITWIYGDPEFRRQTHLWNRLRGIGSNRREPLICLGDFNDICNHWEKVGGKRKDQRKTDGFTTLFQDLQLGDLGFKVQMHTWSNNRGGDERILERLDRVLANETWSTWLHRAQCIHGIAIGSDNAPIMLRLDYTDARTSKTFKFEEM